MAVWAWWDWEDAGLHDPAYAIGGFFSHANQEHLLTATERAIFLDAYRAGLDSGEDPELPARVACYERLLATAWLALLLRAGCDRPDLASWQIHGMAANAKLHRFRARALSDSYAEFEQKLTALEPFPLFSCLASPRRLGYTSFRTENLFWRKHEPTHR